MRIAAGVGGAENASASGDQGCASQLEFSACLRPSHNSVAGRVSMAEARLT